MSLRIPPPALFLAALFVASALPAALPLYLQLRAIAAEAPAGGEPIAVYAHQIPLFPDEPDRKAAGKLTYLGGIVLTSSDPRFGGYSGLIVSPDGETFLAQSDRAYWFAGNFTQAGGHVTGVKDTMLAPMLDQDGKQLTSPYFDSESIAAIGVFPDADILVGFESRDRVDRYAIARDGFNARAQPVAMPADIKNNLPNKGLEGLVLLADGRLLAVDEETLDEAGNAKAWIVPLDGSAPSTLSVRREAPYDVTDLTRLPNGDILMLERRYTPISGPGMRIRRVAKDTIKPGATLDGEVLIELGVSSSIDNMEGIAARAAPDGGVLIYVISDDNQSAAQRTVLLEFEMNK